MILDALCVVHGPGHIGMYQKDGVLYIYTEKYLNETPEDGIIYHIEPGFTKLYLGEAEVVQKLVQGITEQYNAVEVER